MQTLVLDTNAIVKKLEQRGFSRTQAEGITEALSELASPLVTKSDLELALAQQTTKLIIWFTGGVFNLRFNSRKASNGPELPRRCAPA